MLKSVSPDDLSSKMNDSDAGVIILIKDVNDSTCQLEVLAWNLSTYSEVMDVINTLYQERVTHWN